MKNKENVDKDGNTYIQVQPWYKKWWVWLIIIIICLAGKFVYNNTTSQTNTSNNINKTKKVSKIGTYSYDTDEFPISSSKTYNVNYKYTKWKSADIKIDKVKICKTTKPISHEADSGKIKVEGIITLYMTVIAHEKVDIDPDGTIIFSNLEESEDSDYTGFYNSIKKGHTQSGHIKFPIQHLKHISDIKAFRYDFDAFYKDDDDKDLGLIIKLQH